MGRIVYFRKADLDTCMTAVVLGVGIEDACRIAAGDVPESALADPAIICIECGGSGRTDLNNYDHHGPNTENLPPACYQAAALREIQNPFVSRLIDYICRVEECRAIHPPIEFPSLSNLFSGMLLSFESEKDRFRWGISLIQEVLESDINPFETVPRSSKWMKFISAKENNFRLLKHDFGRIRFFDSEGGGRVGYLESRNIGGFGALYASGSRIGILYNPAFGVKRIKKFTIASRQVPVHNLLDHFDHIESGWGGRQKVIGSPAAGSCLIPSVVIRMVVKHAGECTGSSSGL